MNQSVVHQSARYGLVGLCVVAADVLVYLAGLALAPKAVLVSNVCGKTAGALLGFFLHKRFTFSWQQRHSSGRQLASYIVLFLSNLAMSSALLWVLAVRLEIGAIPAKLLVDGIVIVTSFFVSRLWIYRAA
jgi:putative flippase GtrA